MIIHNLVEEHVMEGYETLQKHFPGYCGCEICRADVLVYALNRIQARYVASQEGKVITEIQLDRHQNRTDIDVILMDAFRRVTDAPRCGATGRSHSQA